MDINDECLQSMKCIYGFNCKYTQEQLLDGYKDRKALIRYKRSILGTILILIGGLILTVAFSKSIYFKYFGWYESYIFWLICALIFMTIFIGNHDKFMWNSMPQRIYSPQISNYELCLCEEGLVVIYNITGIKKTIKYQEINTYEVNNYFLLEHEYLNGYYISKEELGEYEIDNIRKFIEEKSKRKIKKIKLPFILSKFARMPVLVEAGVIGIILTILIFNIQANNITPMIGEEIICNNLGIIVEKTEHVLYGNANSLQIYRVNVTLKSYEIDNGKGKKLNPFDFKVIDKNGNQYKWFKTVLPNELGLGVVLGSEEKINRDMYFRVPSNVQLEYLIYTTYNNKSKQFTEKICLKENSQDTMKE